MIMACSGLLLIYGYSYLREDPCTTVVERHAVLEGFELYLVEQWACSRNHPTFIISTFTGQPQHKVVAGVLSVPNAEREWSPRLRMYLKAVSTFHARRKDTPLGGVMVTNLSSFPSALTVIQIPNGDLKEYREMFIVNEDLKRLGCSGRAGLTLSAPTGATNAKFIQLYRTHEAVQVSAAVLELVRLCQVALVMFDKLAPEYADGLLCDVTESALKDWWAKIGTDFYSTEPTDGILGPTTVSAILGLYVGARNRLQAFGAPTGKDAFDVRNMKRAIGYFQRTNKLSSAKPRRLDLATLQRLHRSTSKAAHNERWGVPRAVKSTVAEYGGKGGEMVIGMVGRDKTGIAEVETLDMKRFSETVSGEHCKWLWQGKSKKAPPLDLFGAFAEDEAVFSGDEKISTLGPFKRREGTHEAKHTTAAATDPIYTNPLLGSQSSLEASDKDQALRRTVLKNVTGRMNDARTGLGRFRDAVGGRRSHHSKNSRDNATETRHSATLDRDALDYKSPTTRSSEQADRILKAEKSTKHESSLEKPFAFGNALPDPTANRAPSVSRYAYSPIQEPDKPLSSGSSLELSREASEDRLDLAQKPSSATQQTLDARFVSELKSTRSFDDLSSHGGAMALKRGAPSLPRQASTGGVESVSTWLQAVQEGSQTPPEPTSPSQAMTEEKKAVIRSQQALKELQRMSKRTAPVMEAKLRDLRDLEARVRREYDDMSQAYAEKVRDHRELQNGTSELLSEEEAFLTETFKELEILGAKLEYEMGSLLSKVEDVEDGVADFERQVEDLEAKIDALGKVEVKHERRWPLSLFSW